MLIAAAAVGLVTGVAELWGVTIAVRLGIPVRLSAHYVWMAPLADLCFALTSVLLLLAIGRWWSRARTPATVAGVLVGLASWQILLLLESLYPAATAVLAIGLGVAVARLAQHRVVRRLYGFAPMVALAAALYVGWQTVRVIRGLRSEQRAALATLPAPIPGAPNVLLLILDTVREQGLLDSGRYTVPGLERFAQGAVSFENAIAPAPWTLPSHASMFTGRWPNELSANWSQPLDQTYPTLAEGLSLRGYQTAGFVANLLWTTRGTGLGRGFVTYDDYPANVGQVLLSSSLGRLIARNSMLRKLVGYHRLLNQRSAGDVTDAFLDWEQDHHDRPFFAFLNFFDAHEPTFPPGYSGSILWPGKRWTDFRHFAGLWMGASARIWDKWKMSPEQTAIFSSGYWAAVRSIDAQIGRLLDELDRRGVLDHTVVIITSDHGEQLGEHGLFEHNNSLYMPALQVPLLIRPAGGPVEPVSVPQVVSLRDIPATVLDLVGAPQSEFPGRSLVPLWRADAGTDTLALAGDTAFAQLVEGFVGEDGRPDWYPVKRGPEMVSLTTDRYHYILNGDGSEELYDWEQDPMESANLAQQPESTSIIAQFRRELAAHAQSVRRNGGR